MEILSTATILDRSRPAGVGFSKILVTGGTGAIGRQFVADLRERSPEVEIGVVSRRPQPLEGCTQILWDLTSADPSGSAELDRWLGEADGVVHLAADVRWSQSFDEAKVNNVDSTKRLVDVLARRGRNLRRFVALSTAFVACPDTGLRTSNTIELDGRVFNNSYEASKWLSEIAVRESDLPWSIVRPSLVIGHSRTGELSKFNGLYRIMRLFAQGLVPIMVGNRDGLIDIVPVDFVSEAIFDALNAPTDHLTVWANAGPRAPTFAETLRRLVESVNGARAGFGFAALPTSPILPYEVYAGQLKPRFAEALRPKEREVLASVEHYIPYLSVPSQILPGEGELSRRSPPYADYLSLSMDYWGRANQAVIRRNGKPYDWGGLASLIEPPRAQPPRPAELRRRIDPADHAAIFAPLAFRNLTVKNRLFRSSISGRLDNYDGSGTVARLNFEERFAAGGVGAIISSHAPVDVRGRILPNYATIDCDERIPFWRAAVERAHRHDCKFIIQLSYSGRQQDIPGIENHKRLPLGVTSRADQFHGLRSTEATREEIAGLVAKFADAARRARLAGADGIELHSSNGYLFSQFLSSGINRRRDEYGGSLENRARFLLDVVRAIRRAVGRDFFLMAKLGAVDHHNAVTFWERRGDGLAESTQIARWLEAAGVDGLHISSGSMFPHPRNPAGPLPLDACARSYPSMIASGVFTFRNYLLFRYRALRPFVKFLWGRTQTFVRPDGSVDIDKVEGLNLAYAAAIKAAVSIPVICTGAFQRAHRIGAALRAGQCDAVSMARGLLANPRLPLEMQAWDGPADPPCTHCNRCLVNVLEHPLACWDESRFVGRGGYDAMIAEAMSVFESEIGAVASRVEAPSLVAS